MSYGSFGGRGPAIGNRFISNLIVAGMRWRNASRRLRHALASKPKTQYQDTETLRAAICHWIQQGYPKVNLGGGAQNLKGYVNIDFAHNPSAARQIVADILDLSFVPSGSLTCVHMNHVAEHFTTLELSGLLNSCSRVLKQGGVLSIRCPNALGVAYGFWFEPILEAGKEAFVADGFPEDETFGNPADSWMYRDFYGVLHWFFGDPGSRGNVHKTLLTPTILHKMVESAGLEIVRSATPEAIHLVLLARKP